MLEVFILAFATFFVIIDPIGVAPISVGLLGARPFAEKRRIILRACAIAAVLLVIFGLFGLTLLNAIGISVPAFRISGGILLFITALEILFAKRTERRAEIDAGNDPTVFPLALPLLAGPGALTSMILLVEDNEDYLLGQLTVFATMLLVMVITAILAISANRFSEKLSETGLELLNRFLGVLLAALSVQFIADGILGFING